MSARGFVLGSLDFATAAAMFCSTVQPQFMIRGLTVDLAGRIEGRS